MVDFSLRMMNSGFEMMGCLSKMMDFVFKMMDFVFKDDGFEFKMMDVLFKMMDFSLGGPGSRGGKEGKKKKRRANTTIVHATALAGGAGHGLGVSTALSPAAPGGQYAAQGQGQLSIRGMHSAAYMSALASAGAVPMLGGAHAHPQPLSVRGMNGAADLAKVSFIYK